MNRVLLTLTASVVILAANCSSSVPVQDLTDARISIAKATDENAAEYSPENLEKAKTALLEAHNQLAAEKNTEAKAKAIEAKGSANLARLDSAPKYTEEKHAEAEKGLAAAEEAYAEELAKDDYSAAKKLYEDGSSYQSQAGQIISGLPQESDKAAKTIEALDLYTQAHSKLSASAQASEKAKNTALSQKQDLLDALAAVDATTQKAVLYGAAKAAPEQLATAKAEIEAAKVDINAGQLKSGHFKTQKADEAAQAALALSMPGYAVKRQAEAAKEVAQTDGDIARAKRSGSDTSGLKEYQSAAKEAVASAKTKCDEQKYEECIQESDEAIRLAMIIEEQTGSVVNRKTNEIENKTTTTGSTEKFFPVYDKLPQGWKKYTVQKKKPVDTLWRIAANKKHYKNPFLWKRIYQANSDYVTNPDLIFPGQELAIPPRRGSVKLPEEFKPTLQDDPNKPKVDTTEKVEETPTDAETPTSDESSDDMKSEEDESEQPADEGTDMQPGEKMQ